MKKQTKRNIIIGIIVLSLIVSVGIFISASKTYCVESETEGNLLCFVNEISPLALTTAVRDSYEAGSDIRLGEDLFYYEAQVPFRTARVYLFEVRNGEEYQIDYWDVTASLNRQIGTVDFTPAFFGDEGDLKRKYFYTAVVVKAPSEAGEYIYRDSITSKSGENLDSSRLVSKRGFTVQNELKITVVDNTAVECSPYEGEWTKSVDITGGTQFYKEYGEKCGGDVDVFQLEWKTTCEDGYLAKGSETKVANEKTICIKQELPQENDGGAETPTETVPTNETSETIGDDFVIPDSETTPTNDSNGDSEGVSLNLGSNVWLYVGIGVAGLLIVYLIYTERKR